MWTDRMPPEREREEKGQDGTPGTWFKITVPFGIKYDEKWLLNLIQKKCSVPFTLVKFHYEKMQAQFFVDNANIAFALKNINGKIWDKNNERISIFVSPSDAPCSVQKELKSEKVKQIKLLTMNKLYDVSQQSLDIHKLRFDPDLMTLGVEMVPNPRNDTVASLQVHGENMPKLLPWILSNTKPCQLVGLSNTMQNASNIKNLNLPNNEVKSAGKLDKGKGLKPEEMSTDRNSLCTTFPDKSTNISYIILLGPSEYPWVSQDGCDSSDKDSTKTDTAAQGPSGEESVVIEGATDPQLLAELGPDPLLFLGKDGQESRPPTNFGIEAHKRLPTCKGSFFESDALKSLVLQFLWRYYLTYDSGDRQGLLGAYLDKACFSLSVPFNPKDPAPSILCEYVRDNRNIKKLKDPYLWVHLLKSTKHDIVHSLCVLPTTQHDFSSFVVDQWLQTERVLCFSVNEVFKEVVRKSKGSVRAFTWTFITILASNSSSVPMLCPEQQETVHAFSAQSGMNLQ
ncbi:nuclear RNA export factor 3 [Equus caballus]|uniref:nuclear RNA export factor 3 n=1 Tax=Equus caballus TaxID=9796 RepID=UPI0038B23456